jgi:hypothetical protein
MSEIRLTVNDLPRFSPWPARLLGLEPWQQRHKTPHDVTREFEHEKWGTLLQKVQEADHAGSLEEVDEWSLQGVSSFLCSLGSALEWMSAKDAHERYLELLTKVLQQYLPATALVELGCGYGSIILGLAKREAFCNVRLMAAEYTESGLEVMERLAARQGVKVSVARCDFRLPEITTLDIPRGAVTFTSYASHYVPELSPDFVTFLSSREPRAVVHLEPCYEHCDSNTLLGLMRRRYIEVNDYNRNLVTLLHQSQKRGLIKVHEDRPAVFGKNPLLPASVIVWAPETTSLSA